MEHLKSLSTLGLVKGDNLLAIMPPPDDESAFLGGLLKRASKAGIKTYLLCVTDGAGSTLKYGLKENDSLIKVRKEELKKAAVSLNVSQLIHEKFPDGGVEASRIEIKKCIKKHIEKICPNVVITLEPDGMYGHPDHIALSSIVAAVHNEMKSFKLIYATVNENFNPGNGAKRMAKKEISPIKPTYYMKLNFIEILSKVKAIKSHKSQFAKSEEKRALIDDVKFVIKEHFYIVKA